MPAPEHVPPGGLTNTQQRSKDKLRQWLVQMSAAEASRKASIATLLELHQLCLDQQAQLAFHPSAGSALGSSASFHTPARSTVSDTRQRTNNENSAPGLPSAPHSKSTRPDGCDMGIAKRHPQSAPPRNSGDAVLRQHDMNSVPCLMRLCSGDESGAAHAAPGAHPIQLLTEHGEAAASAVAADSTGEEHSRQNLGQNSQEPQTAANTLQKPQKRQIQDVQQSRCIASPASCSSSKQMLGQNVLVSTVQRPQTGKALGGPSDPHEQDKAVPSSGSKLRQAGQPAEATRHIRISANQVANESVAIAAMQLPARISKRRETGRGIPVKGRACLLSFRGRKAGTVWRPAEAPKEAVRMSSRVSVCAPSLPVSLPNEHVSAPELPPPAGQQGSSQPAGQPSSGSAEGHGQHDTSTLR